MTCEESSSSCKCWLYETQPHNCRVITLYRFRSQAFTQFHLQILRHRPREPPLVCSCHRWFTICHDPTAAFHHESRFSLFMATALSAGAWHTLMHEGEPQLLVPLLVTGCKIWHLRKAGCFFPKMAWLNTLKSLQDGSQVCKHWPLLIMLLHAYYGSSLSNWVCLWHFPLVLRPFQHTHLCHAPLCWHEPGQRSSISRLFIILPHYKRLSECYIDGR